MSKRYPMPIPFGWFGVGYSDELKAGESKPLKYFGKDLVMFRTESGAVKVLDAYCPHLGAHLGYGIGDKAGQGGAVQGETIVCPFHAWRFNGEGECVEIPYAKNLPPKVQGKQCLTSYPVVERNQGIWVWYHPQGIAPTYEVVARDEMSDPNWSPLEKYEWVINCHTQEVSENQVDRAHFQYVHKVLGMPESELSFDGVNISGIQRLQMATPQGTVNGAIYTNGVGAGQGWIRFEGIAETFLNSMVAPIDEGSVHVRFAFSQPMKNGKKPQGGVEAAIIADIVKQLNEDIPIWEHKVYRDQPILCDGDGPIAKYRKWFSQFYA